MLKLPSSAFLRRPRLQPGLLGRTSRGSRDLQTHTFCSSGPSRSHDNPLGLPAQQAGLPRSGSPPKLNISRSLPTKRDIPNVRKVLVVASGKGGVGKSTVAVNLAIAIRNQSALNVGLLDLDIFGPSVPKLMGLDEGLSPELTDQNALVPLRNHGISCMSIGFLIPPSESPDSVVAWRGMMVMKAVQQLLFDVDWRGRAGEEEGPGLDILVIDMPPGTGDVALSLGQLVNIHGAVIVTTPQDIALIDVTKGVNMFRKLNIPIIGSVLNMSSFKCTKCETKHEIFGPMTSFKRVLERNNVELLGQVPLDLQISKSSDAGQPISISKRPPPEHPEPPDANTPTSASFDDSPFIEISRKCLDHLLR
ncbi:ATP-binding protein [Puccinia graminis f. sp. tritici CRL 75-36-700-3]|uniref:ATP-binding protein n=1 Tax=Puccinia graminis f. sp. tritici (strain CRL 75-36-700-3 / race SCCL) TaxID=418459 RepID=E3JRQ0_PUCGT|nr:ATP-binding protein [Puccinia graminis f. sp. tritici CRL 75-36-700-3]EFP74543.1 ATP-binding protein [Puccinia graminis f. sp. tritici CRL 75-36-700-3]